MKIRFILVTNQFVLILSGGDPLILGLLHVAARLIMIETSIACTSKESLAMMLLELVVINFYQPHRTLLTPWSLNP
jgi:hypothetical protein